MSLFENDQYRWRETYFVLFRADNRPAATRMETALKELDKRYQLTDIREDEQGRFESLTVLSPDDNAAMDVTCICGQEVSENVDELMDEIKKTKLDEEQRAKAQRLPACDARFDVYHFEQLIVDFDEDEEEEYMDPGALLIVLEQLAEICDGIVVDPQSGSFL